MKLYLRARQQEAHEVPEYDLVDDGGRVYARGALTVDADGSEVRALDSGGELTTAVRFYGMATE